MNKHLLSGFLITFIVALLIFSSRNKNTIETLDRKINNLNTLLLEHQIISKLQFELMFDASLQARLTNALYSDDCQRIVKPEKDVVVFCIPEYSCSDCVLTYFKVLKNCQSSLELKLLICADQRKEYNSVIGALGWTEKVCFYKKSNDESVLKTGLPFFFTHNTDNNTHIQNIYIPVMKNIRIKSYICYIENRI